MLSKRFVVKVARLIGDDPEALKLLAETCEALLERHRIMRETAAFMARRCADRPDCMALEMGEISLKYYTTSVRALRSA